MLATVVTLLAFLAGQSASDRMLQAAKHGKVGKLRELVEKGSFVDVNYQDNSGWSAVMYAVREGHDKTVTWLLEHGANPALRNSDEETPLIVATKYRRGGMVRKLLQIAPLEIDAVDRRSWSAYTWAVFLNFEAGVDILRRSGAKVSEPTKPLPFHRATDEGVSLPKLLEQVHPRYTDEALQSRIQGEVVVEVLILRDGTSLPIRVARRLDPELDKKAMEAASEWRFEAAKLAGEPVEMVAEITTSFKILEKKK